MTSELRIAVSGKRPTGENTVRSRQRRRLKIALFLYILISTSSSMRTNY